MNQPLLSVCLITYNHVKYIREAIDGVLMQKVNFSWELIIADDFSTDGTKKILQDYKKKYPDFIKLILQDKNVGAAQNWMDLITTPNSKYIAYFEGDDYWIDPLKLQKQVDFMEENENYTMCFHSVHIKNEIPGYIYSYPVPTKTTLSFNDLVRKHYIPSCSLFFLKDALPKTFPNFFCKSLIGDIPLELMLADKGKVYFFNEKMGTYRKSDGGITRNKSQIKNGRKGYIFVYRNLIKYFFPNHFISLWFKLLKTKAGFIKDFFKNNFNF